jgi:hypothetical protein
MFAILHVLWIFVVDIFKSRRRLQAENLFLHHQLNIALRRAPLRLSGVVGMDDADLAGSARHIPGREAGNYLAMASLRLRSVLALVGGRLRNPGGRFFETTSR